MENSNARWLPVNSVIIALNGQGKTRGTVALLRTRATCNQSLVSITPRNIRELMPEFLYWNLRARYDEIRRITGEDGNERRGLNMPLIRNICFPLPPLEEQRQIVAVLDEAFAAIDTATAYAEKNQVNARELFESYLELRFAIAAAGATSEPLEQLCARDRVITYGVIKLGEHIINGVPCLRTSNVRWLGFDLKGMKFIKPALSKEYSRTVLRGSEILVNVRGTLGGVAVATPAMVGWNVSREVAVVPCNVEKIDPQYLAYWIGARTSQDWLAHVQKGVAYTGINISDLRSLPVMHLPLKEQRRIVADLDAALSLARELEATFERKIESLNSLKQSILHRAFSGELTGRESVAA